MGLAGPTVTYKHQSAANQARGHDEQNSGQYLAKKGQDIKSLDVLLASLIESPLPSHGYSTVTASVSSLSFSKLSTISVLSSRHYVLSGNECGHTPVPGATIKTSQSLV